MQHSNGWSGSDQREMDAALNGRSAAEAATAAGGSGGGMGPDGFLPGSADEDGPRRGPLDRDTILDATEACLLEVGYDKTTIRKIAGRLDCAVGSIYRYFKDKRDLLSQVTQRRFESVAQHAELQTPLKQIGEQYWRVANERPALYYLMYWVTSVGRGADERILPGVVRRMIDGLAGRFGAEFAERFWMHLHGGVVMQWGFDRTIGGLPVPGEAGAGAGVVEVEAEASEGASAGSARPAGVGVGAGGPGGRDDLTLL
jgi:AcrR family transcriptional regulator